MSGHLAIKDNLLYKSAGSTVFLYEITEVKSGFVLTSAHLVNNTRADMFLLQDIVARISLLICVHLCYLI